MRKERTLTFLRYNVGASRGEPAMKLTEDEARVLLASVFKKPERAINRLIRGEKLVTRYASYVARMI